LRCYAEGKEGVAWFLFRAKVYFEGHAKLEEGLKKTEGALKEAYYAVLEAKGD
jgi:hypothetical protein